MTNIDYDYSCHSTNAGSDSMTHHKLTTQFLKFLLLVISIGMLNGCFATKIITVPMRVGGAVISVVPVVGNVADGAIDLAADGVDLIPI